MVIEMFDANYFLGGHIIGRAAPISMHNLIAMDLQ